MQVLVAPLPDMSGREGDGANGGEKNNKKSFHDSFIDWVMGSKTFSSSKRRQAWENSKNRTHNAYDGEYDQEEDPDDYVEYTYKPGDTFGQVLLDTGLATEHGLWGKDGDVDFYEKQLNDAGLYGNIPIGTTIRLKRRR